LTPGIRVTFRTTGPKSNFFGYYGHSPLNRSGTKLLAHQTTFDDREALADDRATVGYWDLSTRSFHPIGETGAFNMQQGAMLQWLPPDFQEKIIYNDVEDGQYVSRILDLADGSTRTIPFSVYAIHPSGKTALASNNERLYFCRPGYRYMSVINDRWDNPVSYDDGIFQVDLETGEACLLVSTGAIAERDPVGGLDKMDNYLEIFTWNPSGTRFAFFHRWNDAKGYHTTRFYTAAADGSDLFMFPDTGFYSHYTWKNDQKLTIWAQHNPVHAELQAAVRKNRVLAALFRPPFRLIKKTMGSLGADSYLPHADYLELVDGTHDIRLLAPDVLTRNGHNTWTRDQRWMLTDTYEDENSFRHLLLYDSDTGISHEIGRFFSPYNATTYRCDLHPRFDHNEQLVIIDSAHDRGQRQIYVFDITDILKG